MENNIEDLMFLHNFVSENKKAGKLSIETSMRVEELWNEYKLHELTSDCAVISADFGFLGSLVIRYISHAEKHESLRYESGSYDFVHVKTDQTKRILWTDYQNIEPYNRQSGLYCDGASFEMLGSPVVSNESYREFIEDGKFPSNIAFGIWGYRYNSFYGCITFGMVINKELVDEFVEKLRVIIGK